MNISTKLMVIGLAVTGSALSFASTASAQLIPGGGAISAGIVVQVKDLSSTTGTTNGSPQSNTSLGYLELSAAIGVGANTLANLEVSHNGTGADSYKAFASATLAPTHNVNIITGTPNTNANTQTTIAAPPLN